jgi:hypothetical protein
MRLVMTRHLAAEEQTVANGCNGSEPGNAAESQVVGGS